ncbi:hypothetical protein AAE02nite_12620 [Adhaeribacter aerolatus]|uniref:Lipid/polyisoprenoid-binding YceI-like domain-containing protein n=2 Tax=Adhaeribacter aerolatus TaxID=670289 RepID=A0A512AV59_9BACT|nr:hypothetical protein AAE02nite_12620 [Adhaeribacter aerolatus]
MPLFILFPGRVAKEAYLVVRGERITVQASTSLGDINCSYSENRPGDTLYLNRPIGPRERLVLNLPVKEFACGNMLLNRDFQRTLKSGDHPLVQVEVLELVQNGPHFLGKLRLQVAGKNQVLRGVDFRRQAGQKLSTKLCLSFPDYELSTPQKLGGLVKVEEELQVTVELLLAPQTFL